jgi:hypothetical protein
MTSGQGTCSKENGDNSEKNGVPIGSIEPNRETSVTALSEGIYSGFTF